MSSSANYDWTGQHKFSKQASRGVPSMITESGGAIADSAILLRDNYVAAHDVRKTTNVGHALDSPVSNSWGGNFATYIQHMVSGHAGPHGTLTGGIRAQVETTQQKNGHINDACAGYLGLYNNGVDVGGFGLHVDAYHVGREVSGHSTYAFSAECWKQTSAGRMVSYVARAQEGKVDYGLAVLHSGNGSFKRGIQLGNPSYGMGGVQGAPGSLTQFDIGVDLTHGAYTTGVALMVKAGDNVVLSGQPQAQDWTPVDSCQMRFDPMTGMFAVRNGNLNRFDCNMTTGCLWQNGQATWAGFDNSVRWAFAVGSGKTTQSAGAVPAGFLNIKIDDEEFVMPYFRPQL
jgi:hypothetical protein